MRATRWIAVAVFLAALLAGTAPAQLTPVFEYWFPDSYDGTSTTIVDLSTAGNHGIMDNLNGYIPDNRPPGFTTGGSINGAYGGTGVTNAKHLLANALVQASGGFTMDTWFWADPSQTGYAKLIDYAWTEALRVRVDTARRFNLDLTIYQMVTGGGTSLTTPIESGRAPR